MAYSRLVNDVEIVFDSLGSKVIIGGPLKREEIIIVAALIYVAKGDLSNPVGISYNNVLKFKKFKMDITFSDFKSTCKNLSERRLYCKNRIGSMSILWFESYNMWGSWGVFRFNQHLAFNINSGNFSDIYMKLLGHT